MATTTRFTWLGHATLRCDLPGGEVLLVDPWVGSNPSCPLDNEGFDRLDAVLITHGHFDHFEDAVELARRHQPDVVVANFEICNWLDSQGVTNTAAMNLGGCQEVLGLGVHMVPAVHSSSIATPDGLVPGGEACGYVFRFPDGRCVYCAGDTALFSDLRLIGDLYQPDLAFLPIGDHFTMDPRQAAYALRFLEVPRVVPLHWGTFPLLTGTPQALEQELQSLGVDCQVLRLAPGGSLEF